MSGVTIYGLHDPRTGDLRYIGKTVQTLGERLQGHMDEVKVRPDSPKSRWIRTLDGARPIIRRLDEVPADEADGWERWWIAFGRSLDLVLLNATAGGTGGATSTGRRRPQAEKDAIAEAHRKRFEDPALHLAAAARFAEQMLDPEKHARFKEGQQRRWESYYAARGISISDVRARDELARQRGAGWRSTDEGKDYMARVTAERWAAMTPEERAEIGRKISLTRRLRPLADRCGKGHLFDEANTAWNANGTRYCRTCRRETNRIWMRDKYKKKPRLP